MLQEEGVTAQMDKLTVHPLKLFPLRLRVIRQSQAFHMAHSHPPAPPGTASVVQ